MAQWKRIAVSCGVGCSCRSDPALLWLGRRPAAAAPIRPLAWEPPYAAGAALNRRKKGGVFMKLSFSLSLTCLFVYKQIYVSICGNKC